MPDIHHLGLFIAAGLLLNLTPGPDVLYIVTHALRSGARAGVVAALGITAGCFVHIFAAALGVSALLAASATAFTALKWLGAAYLLYVGASMLLSRRPDTPVLIADSDPATMGSAQKSLKKVLLQGFWTNALNPKVALFFLAFVPQFIAPSAPDKTLAFLLLGALFNFNGLWVNIGWAMAATWARQRLGAVRQRLNTATRWLDRVAGVMFIGFGLKLALSDNPST
jgi:threonine/homoserine/homoserine lactone efflux protein